MNKETLKKDICTHLDKDEAILSDHDELATLVADSFLLVDLVMKLQEDHGVRVTQKDLLEVQTVQDLIEVFLRKGTG